MGKIGRMACIFTPMALTIASFVCLILLELGGWSPSSTTLNGLHFFQANFTALDVSKGSALSNSTALDEALTLAQNNHVLRDIYQIHLWNYCTSNSSNGTIDFCGDRKANFVFDPIEMWAVNATTNSAATGTTSGNNAVASQVAALKNNTEALENKLLGDAGAKAIDAYRKVAKWMFIAYEVSFWTTLATIVFGVLAIFSRWGSFLTWALSFISSFFTAAAVLTSTILFGVLVGALKTILDPYQISLSLGTSALAVAWLSVIFSWAATLFWLFSVCCCSGKSNPHHRSNKKGGLWNAGGAEGSSGGAAWSDKYGRGRGLRVEKTGGGYQRVSSPFLGGHDHGDQVPLQDYAQPNPYAPGPSSAAQRGNAVGFEPFRHA